MIAREADVLSSYLPSQAIQELGRGLRTTPPPVTVRDPHAAEAARARRNARTQRADDISRLFGNPVGPAKPTVSVLGALRYLVQHGNASNELIPVARDMVQRLGNAFVSEPQFNYAKAICMKPRNRTMLMTQYDLSAMNAESFVPGQNQDSRAQAVVAADPFSADTDANFNCLWNNSLDRTNNITFAYTVDLGNGRTRESVRTIDVPSAQGSASGVVGGSARAQVNARWLRDYRQIDARKIPGVRIIG